MTGSVYRRLATVAVLLAVAFLFSGCIVWPCWWCDTCPPRVATVHVYVYDYYTGYPISWAWVEAYEEDWWDWDYIGRWPVSDAGYAVVRAGYLYRDGCGGPEDEELRVYVNASGYWSEWFDLELDYWYPSETLYFYLVPCRGEGGADVGGGPQLPAPDRPPDRVRVGAPRALAPPEPPD